jgi:hypothetical protein
VLPRVRAALATPAPPNASAASAAAEASAAGFLMRIGLARSPWRVRPADVRRMIRRRPEGLPLARCRESPDSRWPVPELGVGREDRDSRTRDRRQHQIQAWTGRDTDGNEGRTMMEILAVSRPTTLEAIRAEALFVSTLQSSESPGPDHVRRAVTTTLARLGMRGCAAHVAGEFGDHPETAVARMAWALDTIRAVYTAPPPAVALVPQPLALAS